MHQSDIGCNTFIGEQTMLIRKSRPTEFCKQSGFRVKNEVRVRFKVLRAIDFQYLVVLCGLYFNGGIRGGKTARLSACGRCLKRERENQEERKIRVKRSRAKKLRRRRKENNLFGFIRLLVKSDFNRVQSIFHLFFRLKSTTKRTLFRKTLKNTI